MLYISIGISGKNKGIHNSDNDKVWSRQDYKKILKRTTLQLIFLINYRNCCTRLKSNRNLYQEHPHPPKKRSQKNFRVFIGFFFFTEGILKKHVILN